MRALWITLFILVIASLCGAGYILRSRTTQLQQSTQKNARDPVLYSISPDHGSIQHQTLTIKGKNLSDSVGLHVQLGDESAYLDYIPGIAVHNGSTIVFDPCFGRSENECKEFEDSLRPGFNIMVQRAKDQGLSNTVHFSLTQAPSTQ